MRDPTGAGPKTAGLPELIRQGLFELFPELKITGLLESSHLWTRFVALQGMHHRGPVVEISQKDILLASNLASYYKINPKGKVPLYMFIDWLARRQRPEQNPLFQKWIKDHYTGKQKFETFVGYY